MFEPLATTTIEGVDYRIGRMDALKQFHVVRKLGPALVTILPTLTMVGQLQKVLEDTAAVTPEPIDPLEGEPAIAPAESDIMAQVKRKLFESVMGSLPAIADSLSALKEEDANYVIYACMDVCSRRQATGWAVVRKGGGMMFADLTLPMLLGLTIETLKANLSDFFPTAQQKESAAAPQR